MRSPHGLDIVEHCAACQLRGPGYFCDFPEDLLNAFEALKYSILFPKGALLFVEGQAPRGILMICAGRVKLSDCSSEGKSLITRIAEPGEVLGLSATISGRPYMATAETLSPCQVNFIKREDFMRFLSEHHLACLRVAEHLSNTCYVANEQVRSLGLSHTAAEKLARLILEWCARDGKPSDRGIQLKLTLTHEEIAQMIGSSRETVTRLLSDFKRKQLLYVKGSTFIVRNQAALAALVSL
ncbi:MAG: family transcriptional regulator, cyclic receptor protein [Blastocatellia bacterium]